MGFFKSSQKKIRRLLFSAYLLKNRIHFLIHLEKTKWFFQLVLNEKYKKSVRVIKYAVAIIGLMSSLFIFPSIIYSFFFAALLFLLQTFIEKTIFSYVSIYVQPLPDFTIEPEKWVGMSFGYATDNQRIYKMPTVGMLINDIDYARKIYRLIRTWNYNERVDKDHNIKMSVILRNEKEYVFFAYPSKERKTVNQFFKSAENKRRKKSLTDVHHQLITQLILGKSCEITRSSYLPMFINDYRPEQSFYFQILLYKEKTVYRIPELEDMVIHNLKIKKEGELTRHDVEYGIIKVRFY